ncbi:LysR family transcriptional regulator [Lentzea albida]|uniref:DNA-binding transcriptional regulator, LysR family n=1 Tax=Lentzea albida TaxID=65499 RepID=A0A1H9WQR9_9PSEU|nr:LysR substrate-binding domain-containing protein [Lentzea albida]SES36272.1 DNA-binding transcriptional regulator, LysR family [Lentzea albida]
MGNRVELRHLRYFVAVAETRHFGQAAEMLNMAQPALSHAIRQLEDELGVCLLARSTRSVELTEAGKFFLDEALNTLNRIDAGIDGARLLGEGQSGLLRIALTGSSSLAHMPFFVQTIRKRLPALEFEVHSDISTEEQCVMLREETLDLGVVHPPVHCEDVELLPVFDERLVVVLPAGHPLAERSSLSFGELRDEAFITEVKPEAGIAKAVLQMCLNAGFSPKRKHVVSNMPTLLALVAAGLGIGVVPESARSIPLPGVAIRSLDDALTVSIALAWHESQRSPLMANVLKAFGSGAGQERRSDDTRVAG